MQKFYEELTASAVERDASLNWLARVRRANKAQINVLQETVLGWEVWD